VGAITHSQEEERRRLSRDLHDDTAQSLLAIMRRLELHQACETDPQRQQQLADLRAMVADTLQGVRLISRDLRPLALDDLGLIPALQALVRAARDGEGGVPDAQFHLAGTPCKLMPEQELALYRIVQEALTNIRRHAHATGLQIDLGFEPSLVRLEVTDDGQGFAVPDSVITFAQGSHFGLMGMQERAWTVGASLTVESQPGRGTRLQVALPTPDPAKTPAPDGWLESSAA
jgi:signal transduction histidine kinase